VTNQEDDKRQGLPALWRRLAPIRGPTGLESRVREGALLSAIRGSDHMIGMRYPHDGDRKKDFNSTELSVRQ
jgi:hypothetical protein